MEIKETRTTRTLTLSLGLFALAVLMVVQAGCYSHVVRAEGTAAGRHDVYEPNLKTQEYQPTPRTGSVSKKPVESKKFLGIF